MLPVVVPILASAIAGGLGYALGSRRPVFTFVDRGWTVRISPYGERWRWTAKREGREPGTGIGETNVEALDGARLWITALQLKGAVDGAKQLVDAVDDATSEDTAPNDLPTLPVPTPLPVEPAPLGGSLSGPARSGAALAVPGFAAALPRKRVRGGGLEWRPATNEILLNDLQDFVAAAFGSGADPYSSDPLKVVVEALQAALPGVDIAGYNPILNTAAGAQISLEEAADAVAALQEQLHSPGIGEEVPAFAADILHEGIFDVEQQQSVSPFAFRGRKLFARPVAGGYRAAIVHEGATTYTDEVVPTVPDAMQAGIEAVRKQDEI